MKSKYFTGREGHYIFCDICGQACYTFEATKLESNTGRGGLIVCPNDVDQIDYGLVPFRIPAEKPVPWTRINHQNVSNGAEPLNPETATNLGV